MPRLIWDKIGERQYETGTSKVFCSYKETMVHIYLE